MHSLSLFSFFDIIRGILLVLFVYIETKDHLKATKNEAKQELAGLHYACKIRLWIVATI
jgi:hypothetical protein